MGHTGSHSDPCGCFELPQRFTAFGLALCKPKPAEQNLLHPIPIHWRETLKPVNPNKQPCDEPVSVSPRKLTRFLEREWSAEKLI